MNIRTYLKRTCVVLFSLLLITFSNFSPAPAEEGQPKFSKSSNETYKSQEIIDKGHAFFGKTTTGLSEIVEYAFSKWGEPNAYIIGEEAGGAYVAGLRYGEGTLYTKTGVKQKVFWQGPSVGLDFGADGSRSITLIYKLRNPEDIFRRYGGIDGSAYIVGGFALNVHERDKTILVPIRTGVGLRLGVNVGYLKYTRKKTWNPF